MLWCFGNGAQLRMPLLLFYKISIASDLLYKPRMGKKEKRKMQSKAELGVPAETRSTLSLATFEFTAALWIVQDYVRLLSKVEPPC